MDLKLSFVTAGLGLKISGLVKVCGYEVAFSHGLRQSDETTGKSRDGLTRRHGTRGVAEESLFRAAAPRADGSVSLAVFVPSADFLQLSNSLFRSVVGRAGENDLPS